MTLIKFYSDERSDPLINSSKSFTWTPMLKTTTFFSNLASVYGYNTRYANITLLRLGKSNALQK